MPSPVTSDVLGRAGIPDSLIPRTIQALQSLDLIDKDGNITEMFESIRLAPEADYQNRLQAWLNSAYADVLAYVDPANDDETKIRDAFRNYRPMGQQGRMVTLFVRLYAAAGVRAPKAAPAKSASPRPRAVSNRLPAVRRATPAKTPAQAYHALSQRGARTDRGSSRHPAERGRRMDAGPPGQVRQDVRGSLGFLLPDCQHGAGAD